MQAALGCTRGLTPDTQTRPAARPRAQRCVPRAVATGSSEGLWLPGVEAPKRLEGLVGNRGFDPFNFAIDPDRLQWCDTASSPRRSCQATCGGVCRHIASCTGLRQYIKPSSPLPLPPVTATLRLDSRQKHDLQSKGASCLKLC